MVRIQKFVRCVRICKCYAIFTRLKQQVSARPIAGAIGCGVENSSARAVPGATLRSMSTFNHKAGGRKLRAATRPVGEALGRSPRQLLLCPFLRRRTSLFLTQFTFCQVKPLVVECFLTKWRHLSFSC